MIVQGSRDINFKGMCQEGSKLIIPAWQKPTEWDKQVRIFLDHIIMSMSSNKGSHDIGRINARDTHKIPSNEKGWFDNIDERGNEIAEALWGLYELEFKNPSLSIDKDFPK